MAEGARAAPAPSVQGRDRAERVGGHPERSLVLPAVRLCDESDVFEQGQQELPLLRLLQRSKARVGTLPLAVRPSRSDGADRAGADREGGPGLRAPKEDSPGGIQAKKNAPG